MKAHDNKLEQFFSPERFENRKARVEHFFFSESLRIVSAPIKRGGLQKIYQKNKRVDMLIRITRVMKLPRQSGT